MTGEMITQVGTIVIAIVGAVVTYVLIPYIKSKTTKDQQDNIKTWVNIAVQAAEQLMDGPGMGENKKLFVLNFLRNKGITLSENQLDILIESAVYQINNIKGIA